MAALQRFVPDSRRGRVFGVTDMFTMAALVAATGVLGLPNIPHLDDYVCWLLAATGAGLLATMMMAWRDYRRGDPFSAPLWLTWRLVRLYAGFWCRAKRIGLCTVPRRGPIILAANHTAGIDPLLIYATCLHRKISFLVAREYVHGLAGWFMRLVDCIPLDRARPSHGSLTAACRLLQRGGCLGIFPQGQFEPPGQPQQATRVGVGWLALRSDAVVIPCHISGTRYSDRVVNSFFHRHNVRVRYGRPVDLSAFRGLQKDRDAAQSATNAIMDAIRALAPEGSQAVALAGSAHGA
jgi:1-acyl-sn-glycerol-3-phosphate acyltransferase